MKRGQDRNQINVLLIYRKEEQAFLRSLDKIQNINFLFNSQDVIIVPADESFDDEKLSIEPIVKELGRIKELAKKIEDGNKYSRYLTWETSRTR